MEIVDLFGSLLARREWHLGRTCRRAERVKLLEKMKVMEEVFRVRGGGQGEAL